MTMVAALLVVPRSTLASAVLLTEREIERAPDPRGRPHALSSRQVLESMTDCTQFALLVLLGGLSECGHEVCEMAFLGGTLLHAHVQ